MAVRASQQHPAGGEPPTAQGRPGPAGLPLIGIAASIRGDPLHYFVDLMHRYGDAVWFRIGRAPVVMLNHPRAVRHVLQDNHRNYHKSAFYAPLKPLLGRGIFLSEDATWLEQRRRARPSFAGPRFEFMAGRIVDSTADMLERWRARGADATVHVLPEMMRLTLDSAARAFFATELTDQHVDVFDALTVMLRQAERRVWATIPVPDRLAMYARPSYRRAVAELDGFVWSLIDERRRNPLGEDDLLTRLVRAYEPVDDHDQSVLRDEVVSIVTAGHETTACALAWALCLLSQHAEAAERLRREVDEVLGGRTPTLEDLDRLDYTRMVFEEAMRLYPPVWTLSRVALEDDEAGGVAIPAGTTVMLCPYAVHRHPAFWPDPERFDPERFAPGADSDRPRHAYFPFGGGPRVCLGNRFAMMEGQVMLAMLAQAVDVVLEPGQSLEPEPMITLRPRESTRMRLRWRPTAGLRESPPMPAEPAQSRTAVP